MDAFCPIPNRVARSRQPSVSRDEGLIQRRGLKGELPPPHIFVGKLPRKKGTKIGKWAKMFLYSYLWPIKAGKKRHFSKK